MRYLLLTLLTVSSLLCAQDSELYYETRSRLTAIEHDLRTASSDLEIVHLLIEFQHTLRSYLERANTGDFVVELGELAPIIERISERSHMFYYRFHAYGFSQSYTVTGPDGTHVCFTNCYCSSTPLSEQQKTELYFLELDSYEAFGIHPQYQLCKEALHDLEPRQVYNFVLRSDRAMYYAPDYGDPTVVCETDHGISIERIISPNHTILAGNQPVLSAGTIVVWQCDDRRLYLISNDSGHFRTDYESLQVFKKELVKMGVDPERVICLALKVDYEWLLGKIERRRAKAEAQAQAQNATS